MANRIKGITVEIGGDTVGLESALKDVNKRTKEVQTELKDVERLLKFDPNNVELLAQRQELLTQAIQSSTDKLNQLRSAQSQVEEQFRSGQIGEEQYRAFRRELQAAEQQLAGYEQALTDMNAEQQRVQRGTRDLQTLFEATGTSVNDYANVIGQRLVRAIQNGTATGRDLEYAFQRIGRQAIGAEGDIERLRATLQSVDSGNSVQNIRRELQLLQSEAEQTAESVEGIGVELQNVAGALVAGGGIAGSIEKALEISSLETKIDISMEIDESSRDAVKSSVREVVAAIGEEEAALEGVRRQWALNKDASDETNAAVITGAKTIAVAYNQIDFVELIQEVNEIGAALGISNLEALGLVNTLLKTGFPPEQLDIIAEYGEQLKMAGYDATTVQNIFAAGVDTKTWNIDNLIDGLKEGRIGLAEFGLEVPKALSDVLAKTKISENQIKKWGKAVAAGGEEGKTAMFEVAKALAEVEDATVRNELGVQLYVTKWEDQGSKIVQTLINAEKGTANLGDNINNLADDTARLDADPAKKLAQAMQDIKTASEPALLIIADIISKIAGWISENPKLAATLASVAAGLGIVLGVVMGLAPLLVFLKGAAVTLGISLGSLIGIIAGVAAGVALLIAGGIALYQNWDTIEKTSSSVFSSVKTTIVNALGTIRKTLANVSSAIADFAGPLLSELVVSLKNIGTTIVNVFNGDFSQLGEIFKMLLPTLIAFMVGGLPGLIISASRFLPAIAEGMESNKGVIIETINGVVASIIEFLEVGLPQLVGAGLTIVLNLIEGIIGALPLVIEVGVSLLQSLIEGIGTILPIIVNLALEVVTSLVSTIGEALPRVIEAGTGILNSVIEGIVSVLPLLLAAALLLITSIAITLVENLPRILAIGVEILTALMAGVVSILPSLITMAINLIITIVKTLVENLPKILAAGIKVLQALIEGIVKILPTLIVTAISLVIQIATAIIKSLPTILKAGKDILFALIKGIVSIVTTLLSAIAKDVVGPLLNKFEDIDLMQIGKDIINGLIKGIVSMAKSVKGVVEELASSLPDWIKKMLGIKSPSRVMADVGKWIPAGLAQGISKNSESVKKASQTIGALVENVTKENAKSISALQQKLAKADKSEKESINKEILELQKGLASNQLNAIKTFIDEKKKLNHLSLMDELSLWRESLKAFNNNSKERILAHQEYKNTLKAINDEIVAINQTYQSKMQTINDNLLANIKAANDEYENAYNSRVDAILNFSGLFDEFVSKNEKSGQDLLNNLQSQVTGLQLWKDTIASLGQRIKDEDLMKELEALGPNAVNELQALNSLSDDELSKYVSLYNAKFNLAREQASAELAGMKIDTTTRIDEMKKAANKELEVLRNEWAQAIKGVTQATDDELASLYQIGKDAGQGLLDGLTKMQGPLKTKAKEIANSISRTIQEALDIHSPSRVMKGLGVNIGQGLVVGMDEMISKVSQSSARLSDAVMNAQASLASSMNKSKANQIEQTQIIQQSNNIDLNSLVAAITQLASRPIQTIVDLDGRVVAETVTPFVSNIMGNDYNSQLRRSGWKR